ncbi:MAG: MBL fold metallo-hydrolase [Marvinbryantia sp.]|uniref:MBL fold metallo-hydrolase n=1 Tax=Marvinbryantia sp. TaxID=2496532 RepID=UPI0026007E73|nr:MBL fold metallo-hydrolase [uncultured Marvinbryantia sp.]
MVKEIDFSCKHDILIENEDGSRQPMDVPFFQSEKIAPGTWKNVSDGDYFYLVEGDEEALVIDSGYGCGNVREYCQSLTEKPVRYIANTHDHFDHTANNVYFDCAFMAAESVPLATRPFPSFAGIDFPRDYKIEVIDEGYVFHLGNRDLEVFKMPDHAVGSLLFLDRKERLLFAGDELGMPMGKPLNGSVERFAGYLETLMAHRDEFDIICAGGGLVDGSIVEKYLENMKYILEGNEGAPFPGEHFPPLNGDEKPVVYRRRFPRPCDLPRNKDQSENKYKRVMEHAGCRVIYDTRKIFKTADEKATERFKKGMFELSEPGKRLCYNLYIPESCEPGHTYPLVLFMHDAGNCCNDLNVPLTQGKGATIWASEEEQKKRPCFVLAPLYPEKTAEDDFTVTWEADATLELIKELAKQYPIDASRIYGTGQSMGCMMLCELMIRHPKFFAACFLVAGQWNPDTMAAVKDENIWALVSEKDIKAFPIMGACMKNIEEAGGKVSYGFVDGNASAAKQNRRMQEIADTGNHIMFTWFSGDSVLSETKDTDTPPWMYHVKTWEKAYDIEAIREWIFKARR